MIEVAPRFTTSPDGIFEISAITHPSSDNRLVEDRAMALSIFGAHEMVRTDNDVTLRVDLAEMAARPDGSDNFGSREDRAYAFIQNLGLLGRLDLTDRRDGVLTIDYPLTTFGGKLLVHPSFQRWMNAEGITEETAKNCLRAMALPFGTELTSRVDREFNYGETAQSARVGSEPMEFLGLMVATRMVEFNVMQSVGDSEHRLGTVTWPVPLLNTLGNCACLDNEGHDRDIYSGPDSDHPGLYRLTGHNIDSSLQGLSLMAGIGALAYEAALYQGEEDVCQDVAWRD